MDEIEKLKQDLKDFTVMLSQHNKLLMSYKEQLDEFKTETRLNSHAMNLHFDDMERRYDNHTHQQYKQGAIRKLYKNE